MNVESQTITLETNSAPMDMYVARPSDGQPHPGVIVGFELFGLTPYIQRMTNRIAQLGYVAVAPDFYHRSGQQIRLNADDAGRKRGFELLGNLSRDQALEDVGTAVQFLHEEGQTTDKQGFVGFSVGGHIALLAAAHYPLQACVAFYPGWLTNTDITLSQPEPTLRLSNKIADGCEVVLFAGENDNLLPAPVRDEINSRLTTAGVDHQFIVFPDTAHGFMCDERPPTYNPEAAEKAWVRVRDCLAKLHE
ncbi:MAG: dienelactone hydrolase family protein [Candidatus Saccharibacteria bacterium]|nr:dienelactone hydrolase family protein [Candidatus Saccharibacteria bacterium]